MACHQRRIEVCELFESWQTGISFCPSSIAALYEHIPWISYYTKMLPWASKDVKQMRKMGFSRTEQRYNQGSTTRDLFYYLVGTSAVVSGVVSV